MQSTDIEDIKSIKVEAHKDEDLLEFVKEFINTVGSPLLTPSNDEIEDNLKNYVQIIMFIPEKLRFHEYIEKNIVS